jgi:hypothetical protein
MVNLFILICVREEIKVKNKKGVQEERKGEREVRRERKKEL